jgi:anhydro-N-acetylmuramic acid kinase
MPEKERLIAGAMSGTSGDGVDVAITQITGTGLSMSARLVHHHHVPFDAQIRQALFAIRDTQQLKLSELAKLGWDISSTYARAVNEALAASNLRADDLSAVAAHGQTLYHDPPNTIQWFDPAWVAAQVGCTVVSDFRRADCAAGGQGAPLVPFADYILFRDATKNRLLLNLGGIANVTWIPANGSPQDVVGFDTGPANCVIDYLARQANLPDGIDRDGALSSAGEGDFQLGFGAIRTRTIIFMPPPKSLDTPEMIAMFEEACQQLNKTHLPLQEKLASACIMAGQGIMLNLSHLPAKPQEIIVSGGGVHNARLLKEIAGHTKLPLRRADEFGIPSDAKEALAFALLGAATLDGVPSNITPVTGAKRAVVLGSITPKP